MKTNEKKEKTFLRRFLPKCLLVMATFLAVTFLGAYMVLRTICLGPSKTASELFVSTMLETGQMKFLVGWFFDEEQVLAITGRNGMSHTNEDVDTGLIEVPKTQDEAEQDETMDINGIELIELSGRAYRAKLMIINDPSRLTSTTIYPWSSMEKEKRGKTLEQFVNEGNYLAGINGGEYYSEGNWGGRPKGLIVCKGEIQYNQPEHGDVMVGMNEDNILVIKEIGGMSDAEVESMVKEERIRDAVTFKDVEKGNNNHFTKLIINGKAREMTGNGSGANPRTSIGQRADGALLLLVTDGRGSAGHLGATAFDLVSIMQEYGAVNAANLDGGSSSAMYYDGAYEMTSVTLYYSTSSWRLPTAFVVERREEAQ